MIDCTPFVKTLNDKPVAVFGLGLSGLSTVRALTSAGAKVMAWDDREDNHRAAKNAGADLQNLDSKTLAECACLVLAPGVPLYFPHPHPVVEAARKAGIEIIGDLEVLHRCGHGCKTIGITGTNGKSTTTALVAHILKGAGHSVAMGGNIGQAVLDLEMPDKDGIFVLEISSFQMDLCPTFRPDIGVLLNITPDHLDRHGTLENYAKAKERMFEGKGLAVIGIDDAVSQKIYERILAYETGQRDAIAVSVKGKLHAGVYVDQGMIYSAAEGKAEQAGSINGLTTLRGAHNHQNAAMAYAVCASPVLGVPAQTIIKQIQTFPGLPHRQYPVRAINGVGYINDSKATNVEAASKALSAYSKIYWIAGGRPKQETLDALHPFIGNIAHAYLIGEATDTFADWLQQYSVPCERSDTLQRAVPLAHKHAQAERGQPGGAGVVLLSPACASYDQFKSFEERGDVFTKLVSELSENQEAAA